MPRQHLGQSRGASSQQSERDLHVPFSGQQRLDPSRWYRTTELAAMLFPHTKYGTQAVHKWITRWQIPTERIGGRVVVLGESVIAHRRDLDRAARRRRADRQRAKLRAAS